MFLLGSKVAILKEPKGYVQGVAYDPLGVTYAVLSSDRYKSSLDLIPELIKSKIEIIFQFFRCLRMYSTNTNKCIHNVNKIQLANKENTEVSNNLTINKKNLNSQRRVQDFCSFN